MGTCDERAPAWPLFLRTMSYLVDVLDSELRAERGLPLTWFDVLVHLADAPEGRMRMNDLSESVLLSRSGMTRLVDRMERAGLLARGECATDRRVVYAIITAKGRNAFRRALPVAVRGVDEHFARHLTPAEERTLRAALGRILAAGESRQSRARAS
jgi:DNA-binding MarR family transcriptional regulator